MKYLETCFEHALGMHCGKICKATTETVKDVKIKLFQFNYSLSLKLMYCVNYFNSGGDI